MYVKLKKSSTLLSIFKIFLKTLRLVLSKLLFLAIAKNDFCLLPHFKLATVEKYIIFKICFF